MPPRVVKSARAENLVLAPGVKKVLTSLNLIILATKVEGGNDMIPVSHARQNRVTPSQNANLEIIGILLVEDTSIARAP